MLKIEPVTGRHRNADAHGNPDLLVHQQIRLTQLPDNTAAQHLCFALMLNAFLDDNEFVTADARDRIH